MRNKFRAVVQTSMLVAFALVLCSFGTALAQLPDGNACWTVHETHDENGRDDETFLMRLHLASLDSVQKSVTGVLIIPNDNPFFVTGMAAKVGSSILMNLTGTYAKNTGDRVSGIFQLRLYPTTLNGTWWANFSSFDFPALRFEDPGFASGTLSKRPCP